MWGWATDLSMLRHAWRRVASNRGGRTAGVDGATVGRIWNGSVSIASSKGFRRSCTLAYLPMIIFWPGSIVCLNLFWLRGEAADVYAPQ